MSKNQLTAAWTSCVLFIVLGFILGLTTEPPWMWPLVLYFVAGFTAYVIFTGPEALMDMDLNKILHLVVFTMLGIIVLVGVSLFNQTKNMPPRPDPLASIQPEKESVLAHSQFGHYGE